MNDPGNWLPIEIYNSYKAVDSWEPNRVRHKILRFISRWALGRMQLRD